jgi:DNA polymerase III epsilon subunit-like protein
LLSFWYVKVTYDKTERKFKITKQWEIFIEDLKEPISDFSTNWGTFGKYTGNKITEKIIKERGQHPMEAAEQLKSIMEWEILFAHNASFDNGVLNTFFNDLKVEIPKVDKFYDTYWDAFPFFFQAIPKYRDMVKLWLDSIAEKILWKNVKEDAERHTALKDSLWCSEILLQLIQEPEIVWNYSFDSISEDEDGESAPMTLF